MIKNNDEKGDINFAQKNERSLSEVLAKKDFDKVSPIIEILQEKGSITPGEAVKVCSVDDRQ